MQNSPQLKEYFFGKKVLVTGGAGFIGSNLVAELLELGAKVLAVDNYISSSRESGNLADWLDHENLLVVEADVIGEPETYIPGDWLVEDGKPVEVIFLLRCALA